MKPSDSLILSPGETPATCRLKARFLAAGAIWQVATNVDEILHAMRKTFLPISQEEGPADLSLNLFVDSELSDQPRSPQPYFRALDHLYFAKYGPCDSMLMDQRERRVIGSFCAATARDLSYWKRVILPVLVGIASASVGVTPLHCACLVKNGRGLLLSGESGAGKSTLALSLALSGFKFLSDDCTYLSRAGAELRCWGLPTPVKLLPDAVRHFRELANLKPGVSLNGELAFEVDPVETFGVTRSLSCEPRRLIFIQRKGAQSAMFEPIRSTQAAALLAADLELLPGCLASQREYQLASIDALVRHEAWMFRHDLPPAKAASVLAEFCASACFINQEEQCHPLT